MNCSKKKAPEKNSSRTIHHTTSILEAILEANLEDHSAHLDSVHFDAHPLHTHSHTKPKMRTAYEFLRDSICAYFASSPRVAAILRARSESSAARDALKRAQKLTKEVQKIWLDHERQEKKARKKADKKADRE